MRSALVLVDVQNDYLFRSGLSPDAGQLLPKIEALLNGFRKKALPVVHVRTLIREDGADAMPHWQAQGIRQCVNGTPGAMPPVSMSPIAGEAVVDKRYFSGFESGVLDELLRALGVKVLVVAGLYAHGCIRATVTDAYQKGYTVQVAADGVASTDPQHALVSREWLDGRAARFLSVDAILATIGAIHPVSHPRPDIDAPAAHIAGNWVRSPELPAWEHFDPSNAGRLLARTPIANFALVDRAVQGAQLAGVSWSALQPMERSRLLEAWALVVEQYRSKWAEMLAQQVGKPLADARDELERTVAHIRTSAQLIATAAEERHGPVGLRTRHCPRGVVAVITPWNNPVALAAAKIASALAFGNSVVWKPALPAPHVAMAVMASLTEAGIPAPLLSVVFGDANTAQALITHPGIAAVTLTGSERAGMEAALLCARRAIPLQGELGGNNAVIIMGDADLDMVAKAVAASAFGFAGQRCTATRRVIVDNSVRDRFTEILLGEIGRLRVGDPLDPATQVGPLISAAHRRTVMAAVDRAVNTDGGRLLCGGTVSTAFAAGTWYLPTLVDRLGTDAALVREETFGPVAVIQAVDGYDEAIHRCNAVPQGLVATFFGHEAALQHRFLEEAQAGILRLNPTSFQIAADAPFGGWKSSGMGPPEHGRWDREFFARPQAIYGELP
ncbi:MAG: aldehyde dehydrogenase family protein [Rhodocyclaceae bacterium]|nr:MAG: aldehyde dehydrogenase family protein [Rhodocyclaceae bacterium]